MFSCAEPSEALRMFSAGRQVWVFCVKGENNMHIEGRMRSILRVFSGFFGVTFGPTLGLLWGCFGGAFGATLGLLWGYFGATLGVLLLAAVREDQTV